MSRRTDGAQREHLRKPRTYGPPPSPENIARRAEAEAEAGRVLALMQARRQAANGMVEDIQAPSADPTEGTP